jgi:hypothetical protein
MITYAPEVENSLLALQDRFVWETMSFEKYERGPAWYAVTGVISLFLLAYSVWTENFLFAFLILLADITLILGYRRDPQVALVQVGDNGVVWHGKLHLYQDIEHFAIVYQPPVSKVLYIQPKNTIHPWLRIDLEEQDPISLREHLRQYIPENLDLQNEYPSDTLGRLLRM